MTSPRFRSSRALAIALMGVLTACGRFLSSELEDGSNVMPGEDAGTDAGLDAVSDGNSDAQAGKYDGVCSPGDPRTATFDPDCLYSFGRSTVPDRQYFGLFHSSAPFVIALGFDRALASAGRIRPTDGTFAFIAAATSSGRKLYYYRKHVPLQERLPLQQQEAVPTPRCSGGDLDDVDFFPDDGELAYHCAIGNKWNLQTSDAELDLQGWIKVALGVDRTVLVRGVSPGHNLNNLAVLQGGAVTRVTGVERLTDVYAARSMREGGFLVATHPYTTEPGSAHLYKISAERAATYVGAYRIGPNLSFYRQALAPDGTMECVGDTVPARSGEKSVFRVSIDRDPVQLYELSSPNLSFDVELVSGP